MTLESEDAAYFRDSPAVGVESVKRGKRLVALLESCAKNVLAQYDMEIRAGGEPNYPQWADDLLKGK